MPEANHARGVSEGECPDPLIRDKVLLTGGGTCRRKGAGLTLRSSGRSTQASLSCRRLAPLAAELDH